jgi:hypothetical protein
MRQRTKVPVLLKLEGKLDKTVQIEVDPNMKQTRYNLLTCLAEQYPEEYQRFTDEMSSYSKLAEKKWL